MEKNKTILVDEHLQAMQGVLEAGTDDFFYTRLKARMERERAGHGWSFPLKPAWVVGALTLLLAVNGFMLSRQFNTKKESRSTASSPLQSFAESYDQSISSSY